MWRNIYGHAFLQIGVLLILMFFGKGLFGLAYEDEDPFYPSADWIAAHPGSPYEEGHPTPKVEMFTIIFQVFICMQLFNMINARHLGERDYNVFRGFCSNWMFIAVYVLMWVVQLCAVQFGGRPLRTVPLDTQTNLICVALGSVSLLWGFIIKVILPASCFTWMRMQEHEMSDKEEEQSLQANLRRSFRNSRASSSRRSNRQALTPAKSQ